MGAVALSAVGPTSSRGQQRAAEGSRGQQRMAGCLPACSPYNIAVAALALLTCDALLKGAISCSAVQEGVPAGASCLKQP